MKRIFKRPGYLIVAALALVGAYSPGGSLAACRTIGRISHWGAPGPLLSAGCCVGIVADCRVQNSEIPELPAGFPRTVTGTMARTACPPLA
jgi:hypothetical protein